MKKWLFFFAFMLAGNSEAQDMIQKGSVDITRYYMIRDSTAGTPETGVTITGLDLQYTRNRTAPATKVDATALATTSTAHTDNRCIEIDGTSSPGVYRCDWPDAAFATGVDKVVLCVTGTGFDPACEEIQLVDFDPEDSVRLGLTALPNANADAAGGLPISDAGGLDLDGLNTNVNDIETDTADMQPKLGTITDLGGGATIGANLSDIEGQTDDIGVAGAGLTEAGGTGDQLTAIPGQLSALTTGTADSGSTTTMVDAALTQADTDYWKGSWIRFTSGTISGQTRLISAFTPASDTVTFTPATTQAVGTNTYEIIPAGNISEVTTLTGHTAQTGDSYARLGAPAAASVSADILAIDNFVDNLEGRLGTPSDFGSGTSTIAANLEDLADNGTATYDRTTDSLQAIRDRGDSAWTTGAGGSPPQLLQSTTIATLATQTSFTLTAGSADNDAYNGAIAVVTDQTTAEQKAVGSISDYVGASKTVTLSADPGIFTMAVGDTIEIIAALGSAGSAPTAAQVADAVWDESTVGHTTAGTFGEQAKTDIDAILDDTGTSGVVLANDAITAAKIAADAIGASEIATDAIGAPEIAASAITSSEAPNLDAAVTTRLAPTTAGRTLDVTATGEAGIDLDNTAGTLAKTTDITGFNDVSTAQVNSEVDTALSDIRLDELLAADSDIDGLAPPVTGSVFFEALSANVASFTFNQTTDSNEAIANSLAAGVDVAFISGDGPAADSLEALLDGTGGVSLSANDFSLGIPINAGIERISGDATAATNMESFFDGTGYAGTNNVIPTVTTLTGHTPQTGDSFARLGAPAGASVSADIAAVQADTDNIQTRIPAALVAGKMDSDATAFSGSTTAADTMETMMDVTVIEGAATSTTLSTTQMSTNLTETTNDHYVGLVLTWTSGNLAGQSTVVSAYNGTTKTLTFTAVTEAPGDGDTFALR